VRVLIDYRSALRERSGVGEYAHELSAALLAAYPPGALEHPLELTLFSSSWRDRLALAPELGGADAIDRRIPVALLNLAWHRLGRPTAETLSGRAIDVTHSLHPLLLPTRDAAAVVTIHDLDFLAHPGRTRAEIRRDYPVLARAHAHRADRIIVPSHFVARDVVDRLGIPLDKISVCSPGAPPWQPREAPPGSAGYLLFFGTLEPRKNLGALLDAYEILLRDPSMSGLPDLVVAGRATREAEPWLERIARPPLAGHVRHLGYVAPANRQALYAGAHLLVQPSFDEGFGLPVLEAMTVGVPVVAANRGALPEVLGDAGVIVNIERPDDLASGMARLLNDSGFAQACALAGVARSQAFTWRATAAGVYDAYARAIASRAAGRTTVRARSA
jgi:glycosyltransferase involved in cell wall biosynthesis